MSEPTPWYGEEYKSDKVSIEEGNLKIEKETLENGMVRMEIETPDGTCVIYDEEINDLVIALLRLKLVKEI
jgi:hypothetical protein